MIVSYEKGKASPDELFMSRLSKYTGVSIDDLLHKKLTEEDLRTEEVEKLEKGAHLTETKKPGPEGPDWEKFALKMEKLAQSWEHLCDNQRIFIDQMRAVSFNLNKLLLGFEAPQAEEASARPAAAEDYLQTGHSGPFQISTHNVPAGSSEKKGS